MNELKTISLDEVIGKIAIPDSSRMAAARQHLDTLTKPLGSLGRLEDIAAQMIAIRGENIALPLAKAAYVFAADHGITAEGVSAYPREVTHQMVLNFLSDGAAINVLARLQQAKLTVVDVGVDAEFGDIPGLLNRKVRRGTRNMLREPAMNREEVMQAIQVGTDLAAEVRDSGCALVAIGEMGIGNTTSASAITASLTGLPVAKVTGRGAGLTDEAYQRKVGVLEAVLQRHGATSRAHVDALVVLQDVGGLEIAAMTGMALGCAYHGIAIIADGFISTAAVALAYTMAPAIKHYTFAGHCSEERGHRVLLDYIGLQPILSLGMRLGEATGAVLAMPIIESALRLYQEMATFASAGVSEASA